MNDDYIYKYENIVINILGELHKEGAKAYMSFGIYDKKAFAETVKRTYGIDLTEEDVEYKKATKVTDNCECQLIINDISSITDGTLVTIAELK